MSAYVKSKLKAARDAIGKKDYETARDAATGVLDYEPDNYNANVFLALSLLELGDVAQSEQIYRKAIAAHPEQALAWQGIIKLYERTENWEKYAESLYQLAELFSKANDAVKCAETLQKLIVLRSKGTRVQLADALSLLLPDSPFYGTISTLPPPDPEYPMSTTTYEVEAAVHNYLPVMEEIIALLEQEETETVKREVDKRRMRLGASGPEQLKKEVGREVWGSSRLPDLYNEVLNHPNTSDELRRATESKLLRYKRQILYALPVSGEYAAKKTQIAAEIQDLISGMVLLEIPDELAWTLLIESKDAVDIEDYDLTSFRKFIRIFPSSPLGKLISAYFGYSGIPLSKGTSGDESEDAQYANGEPEEFVDVMIDAFNGLQSSILAHRLVAEMYEQEGDLENAVKVAESGLELVAREEQNSGKQLPHVRKAFNDILAISLVHLFPPKHHQRAMRIIDDVLAEDPNNVRCLMGRGYILQHTGKWNEAAQLFSKVADLLPDDLTDGIRAREEYAWCLAQAHDPESAAKDLRAVLEELEELEGRDVDKARCWWRLGKCYWEMGDENREEAYRCFITALKRCPTFAPAFTSLGIYYSDVASPPDPNRASKCFQKAFELDPREAEAARRLAEGFAEESEWDLVEVVARRTIEGEGGLEGGAEAVAAARYLPVNAWAWKAVGVVELNRQRYSQAIQAFQVALRTDADDQLSWLRLGEAYSRAGRYAAALKALTHAKELKPDDWISSYFIGEVQRLMGQYQDAINAFSDILIGQPSELSVLVALGQAHLDLGRAELAAAFTARAEASFVSSIRVTLQSVDASPGFRRITWKTAADALFHLSRFSAFSDAKAVRAVLVQVAAVASAHLHEPVAGLISLSSAPEGASPQAVSLYALRVAIAAYDYRISLGSLDEAARGSASYDLGIALSTYASMPAAGSQQDQIKQEAVRCLKESLSLDPTNDRAWNGLGNTVFESQPRTAQHAYIKALELDSKNPIPWTNLGLFYLHHGDAELANEAFYKAQVLDPDYSLAWVGQGLVAIHNGHELEATALFEHAVGLSAPTPDGDVIFAKRLFDSESQAKHPSDAMLPAFFVLDRFVKQRPHDAYALHLFGLVCERVGHIQLGIELIERAIAILEAVYEESEDPQIERQFTIAHTNVARLRLSLGDYEGALESYQASTGLLPEVPEDPTTACLLVQSQFGAGLANLKVGRIQEALELFEAALGTAENDPLIRGHVVVLFAQALWAVGSEEGRETAKAQLLQSIEADPDNLAAINTLAGMGILTDDDGLVDAALSEILGVSLEDRQKRDPERDVTYLLIQHHLGQGDATQALSVAQKAAMAEPSRATNRARLASLIFRCGLSGFAAQAKAILGSPSPDGGGLDQLRELLPLYVVTTGQDEPIKAFKSAQKAVMLAPWEMTSWQALAYARSRLEGSGGS